MAVVSPCTVGFVAVLACAVMGTSVGWSVGQWCGRPLQSLVPISRKQLTIFGCTFVQSVRQLHVCCHWLGCRAGMLSSSFVASCRCTNTRSVAAWSMGMLLLSISLLVQCEAVPLSWTLVGWCGKPWEAGLILGAYFQKVVWQQLPTTTYCGCLVHGRAATTHKLSFGAVLFFCVDCWLADAVVFGCNASHCIAAWSLVGCRRPQSGQSFGWYKCMLPCRSARMVG